MHLDAVHLTAALELGDELDGIVTYNDRLAAALHGITVVSPHGGDGLPGGALVSRRCAAGGSGRQDTGATP